MTKILFLMDTLTEGGAEKVLRTLVNNMDRNKFSITVQTLGKVDPQEYLVPEIQYKAINRCKTEWGKKLFRLWIRFCAEVKWLYPFYIRDDYDIEVAYLECGPTKFLAGSTNKKALKLAWVHCDLAKKEGMASQTEKLKKYYRAYDKVVCVSENVKDSFVQLFGETPEAVVLYNVNDEEEILKKAQAFAVPKEDVPVMIAVGRLTEQKGFDRLINACAMLRKADIPFLLRVLGEGPERQNLEELIRQNHLEDQIQLLGFRPNPYPYMNAADMVVCSSRYEGFSTVITEALILGKPVVTTPCSGMDELLGDSEFGLITEDGVEGIYQGIRRLLENPNLRRQYEIVAFARGKDFSKKRSVEKTELFFEEILEKK